MFLLEELVDLDAVLQGGWLEMAPNILSYFQEVVLRKARQWMRSMP